ncbi:MAG TPA: 50S ribosomal protein L25 [Candidatus Saccharimonadales bacterium]|nr:50S ribosomal protein L25 [Candidatus Saccharimonadales bacterium]
MSGSVNLNLEERTVVGKAVKKLRRDGFLPAVIHDHGKPSIHVMGKYLDVYRAYQEAGKHHPINITVGGKSFVTLIKTAEFEPYKHQLNHIVFGAVKADEKVEALIPIRLTDEIPAEKASLIIINQLDSVNVEALPGALPDEFIVDASKLIEIGDKVTVADIIVPEGVTILTEPEHTIATVYEPSALAAANDAAGGDAEEPEEVESEEGAEGETPAEEGDTEPESETEAEPKAKE